MIPARRRVPALVLVVAAALAVALAAAGPAPVLGQEEDGDPVLAALQPLVQVLRYLDQHYYKDVSLPALVRGAIDGALAVLGDPNTTFFNPSEYDSLQIDLGGSYSGVGMVVAEQDGYVVVQSLIPGSPAEEAGLQPGDRILRVDGRDVVGERAQVVGSLVRGPEGTSVTLTIQRGDGAPFDVQLVRRQIQLPDVDARMIGDDVGYIRVYQFYEGVGDKVRVAYERFRDLGARGVILDLRNNPGGLLSEAVDTARAFVPRGAIVHIVSGGGKTTYNALPHPPGPPVAVLVDRGSASASEIVAAAIRENGVGFLVGTRTFGKGTVQTVVEFEDGSGFKFTTAEYLTPQGRSIDGSGLEPDVPVDEARQAPPEFSPLTGRYVLARGTRGLEVEGLQQRLRYLGYEPGGVDGSFGLRTEQALRAFQRDHGVPVTGRLDAATFEALSRALSARSASDQAGGAEDGDRALERAVELLRSGQWRSVLGR